MLERAQAQCRGLANVALVQSTGSDFGMFDNARFDLICAIDVFPYLAAAGPDTTARVLQEAHRVMRPHGSLLILNYSYRADLAADRAEVTRLANDGGWSVVRLGSNDFDHWDGHTFHLLRTG